MRGTINYCRLGVYSCVYKRQSWGGPSQRPCWLRAGGSFIYSLLLFILCLVFAEGCISRTHSLGPTMPWELSLPSPARRWVT